MLTTAILIMIIGFVLLAWSADRLVIGASRLAQKLNISPLTIGVTIVALGTSLPEIVVSIYAALYGNPDVAIGNVLGSNIANIGLVLGVTVLLVPLTLKPKMLLVEFPLLLLVMVLFLVLIVDGVLSRYDGFVLLVIFLGLIFWLFKRAQHYDAEVHCEFDSRLSLTWAWIWLITGIVILPISSHLIVSNAVLIAKHFGVSDLVVGLTLVALGTSLPELATVIMGAFRKQYDLVVGNVIGSNIFNLVAVLCLPAVIKPLNVSHLALLRDLPVMFIITLILYVLLLFGTNRRLSRLHGLLLIAFYVAYLFFIVIESIA